MSQPPDGPSAFVPGPDPARVQAKVQARDGLSTARTSPSTTRSIRSTPARGAVALLRAARPSEAAPLLLVSGAAFGAYSVSVYRLRIVVAYLVLLAVLAAGTWRRLSGRVAADTRVTRLGGCAALLAAGVLIGTVPAFSYVTGTPAVTLRTVLATGAVVAGLLLALPWRHAADAALAVALACYVSTAAAVVRLDPAPRIDVWYTLQGAADGLLHGHDMYREVWVGPPGPMPDFTYLPWTAVLLAPARWLAGDVRWALIAVTVGAALAIRMLLPGAPGHREGPREGPRDDARAAAGAAALLLLLPGTLTQVEQAWTEPLLLACLGAWVLALSRGRTALAVVMLALAIATKQHVLLLLPVLAAWPRFGPRRTAAAAGLAGALVLPWFVADPGAMWHDTVTLLVNFRPLRFADTVYIAVLNEWGVRLPFWLTGAVVAGVIVLGAVAVRRHDPPPAVLLRVCALVLLAANLVNKQAFYNQFWLVAGLVVLSWAAPGRVPDAAGSPAVERSVGQARR